MTAQPIPHADLSDYRAMQAEAKARGLRYTGIKKADLVASLTEARSAETAPAAPAPSEAPEPAPSEAPSGLSNRSLSFGFFVWYEFLNSKITPAALRRVLDSAGFSEAANSVAEIDETGEVRGHARRWKTGRGNADRYKSEVSHEDDHTITIGILRREQVEAKKVGWVQIDSLAWDKANNSWLSRGYSPEADTFRAEADERRVFIDHATIRPILSSLVEALSPISLRRAGGIWFVPNSAEASDTLPRLERFVGAIGDSYLSIAEQTSDSARRSTAREVRSGLAEQISDLREQIGEWKTALRNPRKDAVENVLSTFVELRDRADLYASALSIRLDGLRGEIEEIEGMARAFVRDESSTEDRKRPSAGLLALLSGIVEEHDPNEDGDRWIAIESLDGTGLPSAMFAETNERYWTSNTVGVRALAHLGYSVEHTLYADPDSDEPAAPFLRLSPLASEPEASEE